MNRSNEKCLFLLSEAIHNSTVSYVKDGKYVGILYNISPSLLSIKPFTRFHYQ